MVPSSVAVTVAVGVGVEGGPLGYKSGFCLMASRTVTVKEAQPEQSVRWVVVEVEL